MTRFSQHIPPGTHVSRESPSFQEPREAVPGEEARQGGNPPRPHRRVTEGRRGWEVLLFGW